MAASVRSQLTISKLMCYYSFDVLLNHLESKPAPPKPAFTNEAFPLFVTWHKRADNGTERLRGCIGTFEPISLHDGIARYALIAALEDSRFNPVTRSEVDKLSVAVSLLTNFEPAKNYLDWEVGVHGIRIAFRLPGNRKTTATFLPEVASQEGWDKLTTINQLLEKGGWHGAKTQELYDSIELTRYQSEKLAATYAEYIARADQ